MGLVAGRGKAGVETWGRRSGVDSRSLRAVERVERRTLREDPAVAVLVLEAWVGGMTVEIAGV